MRICSRSKFVAGGEAGRISAQKIRVFYWEEVDESTAGTRRKNGQGKREENICGHFGEYMDISGELQPIDWIL